MMCDNCGKNPATTHLKTVINGKYKESHLCTYCAAKEGYGSFGNLSLTNMLATMLGDSVNSNSPAKRCQCCGASFSDIAQSGRVGCSECYTVFRDELMPSLNRLHGKTLHIGKAPEQKEATETLEEKISKLKKQLADAVSKEDFESAVKLRDEIRELERQEEHNA